MFGFKKSPTTVVVGPQLAEVLEILVKVRTPVGEFIHNQPVEGAVLAPGDSVTFNWKWDGFKGN